MSARYHKAVVGLMHALTGLGALTIVALIGVLVYLSLRTTPFDPLTVDTVKIVTVDETGEVFIPQVSGIEAPSIYSTDYVPLRVSWCSTADEAYDATFSTYFHSVVSEEGLDAGVETRVIPSFDIGITIPVAPGCNSSNVPVAVPPEVAAAQRSVAARWFMVGIITPEVDGGVTTEWVSNQFIIVDVNYPTGSSEVVE